ncbi:MAG: ABC transporter permease [Cyclobacteriaceae bacterium]
MLKSFFIATIRNLRKNPLYSFINIAGLSIGIACSILILLWVTDETSFDKFVPKSEKLYQVWVNAEFDDKINSWRSVPLPTYEAIKNSHSAVVNTTVASWLNTRLLSVGDKRVIQEGYWVGDEFLDMFEFELTQGNPEIALADPMSIVITENLASILFKDEDPMGQIIKVDDQSSLQVTGILKDLPGNSTFQFEFLIPWKHRESISEWVVENKTNWGNYSFQVFVELADPMKETAVEEEVLFSMLEDNGENDFASYLFLHPMHDWRLHSNFENGVPKGGNSDYVKLFTAIAIFILIIACINFMNLATARSEKRAREVGIRKSLGSSRRGLILQFIGESVFISFLSFVIALVLAMALLPFYNDLVDKQLAIDFNSINFWVFTVIMIAGTGLISGSYPAFYLSSFDPVITLKGSIKIGRGVATPRKVLVVLQFFVSMILMVGTVVIYQQINLVQNRDLGYDQEALISVEITDEISEKYDVIKTELMGSGAVEGVTRSNSQITGINSNNFLGWPGKPEDQRVIFTTIVGGYDYARTMGIDVLHGRDFSKEYGADTSSIVINKAALDLIGLEDPIGTSLDLWGEQKKLIGVVDNVLMGSPYEAVKPLFMILGDWGGFVSIRLKKGDIKGRLAQVEEVFNKHNPAYPFEYNFEDAEFQQKFTSITMTRRLASLFAGLAIFITGMGLFGLASFIAEQRTKEIGIRKVLGATVSSLIGLISKDFSKLVLVSFIIAVPTSWYLLNEYLERYAIRVEISWWIFPIIGLIALGFALLIVSNQAGRAARTNPVKSLRQD